MSVILNALKKSEHERQAGRAPSAPAPAHKPPPAKRPWPWIAAAGAALGITVVAGAVLWRPASPPLVTEAKAPTASPPPDNGARAGVLRSDDPTPPSARATLQREPARPAWPVPMAAVARHPRPPHHGAAPKPLTVAAREAAVPVRAVNAIAAPPHLSRPTLAVLPSHPVAAAQHQRVAMAAAPPVPLAGVAPAPRPRAPSPAPAATVADTREQTPATRGLATPLVAAPRQAPVRPARVQDPPPRLASAGQARAAAIDRPEPSAEAAAPPGETVPPVADARDATTPGMTAAPAIPVAIEPMAEAPRHLAALDNPVGPIETARRVPPAVATMPTDTRIAPAPLVEAAAPPPRPRPRPRNVVDPYATVPMLATLPRTFVLSVPRLALSLHVYDKEPGNRLVRLNGNTYREGDVTADGMTLDAIVPNGLVLRYEGRQFRVRM
jgi:general secretion pathway protein B